LLWVLSFALVLKGRGPEPRRKFDRICGSPKQFFSSLLVEAEEEYRERLCYQFVAIQSFPLLLGSRCRSDPDGISLRPKTSNKSVGPAGQRVAIGRTAGKRRAIHEC
jgi:hypothetical protein